MCAGYLFQQDKQYDITYDTGDKAIQCGRHVDIFKFWLMWKAKVINSMEKSPKTEPVLMLFRTQVCVAIVCSTVVNLSYNWII